MSADRQSCSLRWSGALCLLALAGLLFSSGPALYHEWSQNPNCEHVGLALCLALFFFLTELRRSANSISCVRDHELGRGTWVTLIASWGALVFYARLQEVFFLGLGFWGSFYGLNGLIFGRTFQRRCRFSWLLLFFTIPLPFAICRQLLHGTLQRFCAESACLLLAQWNPTATVFGTVIYIDGIPLNVAEACSGLRFLTNLLLFALAIGALFLRDDFWGRAGVALLSFPVALGVNTVRLFLAGWLVGADSLTAAQAFLHGWAVYPLYLFSVLVLFIAAWGRRYFTRRLPLYDAQEEVG